MKSKQDNIFSSKTLSYFLQLAETMNYTQAAQILGITQPALTQQIKKLERTVGAPLFFSVGKKLHLSDAGATMLSATQDIYEVLNQATDEIQRTTSATSGVISIGFLASVEDSVFNAFIAHYYEMHPDISVNLRMMTRREIWEHLENNQIDLAIMYLPDDSIKNWKPYESRTIFDEKLMFLHHDASLKGRDKVSFEETTNSNWVSYPDDYFLAHLMSESYKNQMVTLPKPVAQFTTPYQLAEFSNRTGVDTALPGSFYNAHEGEITADASLFNPSIEFALSYVYRKGKDQIPRIANFLDEFNNYLQDKDYLSRVVENRGRLIADHNDN
ncbi:LysR family transcriptional regulator [Lacticaseibacillus pabuli]|uniref:LysR family transcriptional regulator n=1 Tax=Lacticaseibacillus pabuli TaxID=3025672 RepID=A0ABY7WMV8_9LACO|nr:LysR family transcriptional regulator [Lacticaseibacillus sp. KACC 23028]WDF81542.1 LysR family transcriptional regulator [Lacticaseibacillus sp. KACC 23028]